MERRRKGMHAFWKHILPAGNSTRQITRKTMHNPPTLRLDLSPGNSCCEHSMRCIVLNASPSILGQFSQSETSVFDIAILRRCNLETFMETSPRMVFSTNSSPTDDAYLATPRHLERPGNCSLKNAPRLSIQILQLAALWSSRLVCFSISSTGDTIEQERERTFRSRRKT